MCNAHRKQIPRKLFFIFIFSILLIGIVSAETFHQQNKNLTISFVSENLTGCFLGNTQYPDGTISIQNLSLNSGSFQNLLSPVLKNHNPVSDKSGLTLFEEMPMSPDRMPPAIWLL